MLGYHRQAVLMAAAGNLGVLVFSRTPAPMSPSATKEQATQNARPTARPQQTGRTTRRTNGTDGRNNALKIKMDTQRVQHF